MITGKQFRATILQSTVAYSFSWTVIVTSNIWTINCLFFTMNSLGISMNFEATNESPLKRELILWNIKDILIDKKPVLWASWFNKNVVFIKD